MPRVNAPHPQWQPPHIERGTAIGVGVGLGVAAVGAAIGVAADQLSARSSRRAAIASEEPRPGELSGRVVPVESSVGTPLHVEIDDRAPDSASRPTVVMTHGYTLTSDSWHFQRLALREHYRVITWDHRGHGQSPREDSEAITIDALGDDLAAVIAATCPTCPVILLGHSMGGMTTMAFAERHPDVVREQVVGVGLIATAAYNLRHSSFGWGPVAPLLRGAMPPAVSIAAKVAPVTQFYRKFGAWAERAIVRRYSFASRVPRDVSKLASDMIGNTHVSTVADFFAAFNTHDKRDALTHFSDCEALIVVGTKDLLTPQSYSDRIAARMPHAEYACISKTGHLVMLERPVQVNSHVLALCERATARADRARA